ncbi:MAG: glycosyltransferase family 4 protein [Eubacteriaceae bacterium]|nr:glycosyltransferase family 4 protein [Eubacteriaceae bacterium]
MKILVITQHYWPEQFNITEICEGLASKGHEVCVLAGLPNYPSGVIPEEYRRGKNRLQVHNNVTIIRVKEIARGKAGIIKRALNYFSYVASSCLKVRSLKDFDIIFGYQTSPIYQMQAARIAKRLTGKPLFIYCTDLWPESLLSKMKSRDNLLYKLTESYSQKTYNEADAIVVTSQYFIEYINTVNKVPLERISYIPQHASGLFLRVKSQERRENEKPVFLFAGNIGKAQSLETIVEAAHTIKDKDFVVNIVGDGSELASLKELVALRGLTDKFNFFGWHPIEEMPEFYGQAHACLLTLKRIPAVEMTMPAKLQGYMAAGKPVFAAINGAARDVIEESRCGGCVDIEDGAALGELMGDFIDNPEKYAHCGQNARDYFKEHFEEMAVTNMMENALLSVIAKDEKTAMNGGN